MKIKSSSFLAGCMLTVLCISLAFLAAPASGAPSSIVCASTTSTQNTGLFDYLLPKFTEKTGIDVKVIAVGTGQALAMAKRGDADVLLVHAPEAEKKFIAEGYGLPRREVMYNDFVILGPTDDPAGIKSMKSGPEAFAAIAKKGATFISRGDDSGTNKKEMFLWKKAGVDPKGKPWYRETGQGMSATLRIADEQKAYTLCDRATWLSMKANIKPGFGLLVEGDPLFYNQYSVIVVNPEKFPHLKTKEAQIFADWLVSPEAQKLIGQFKDKNGNVLFHPNAK